MSSRTMDQIPETISRFQTPALIVGVVGLLACGYGAVADTEQFFRSYLVGCLLWGGVMIGCLAVLMIQHLSGGGWGIVIRRALESGTRTYPVILAFFLPIFAFGFKYLYEWTHPDVVQKDAILTFKAKYLNLPFFWTRMGAFFALWGIIMVLLNKWSKEQDTTPNGGNKELRKRMQFVSGPGLVLLALSVTFFVVDVVMSLEPHWFSTVLALIYIAGSVLSALSVTVGSVVLMSEFPPFKGKVQKRHYRDLGNLMLAFTMLWAYTSLSQLLITWSANLREEIPWYLNRINGGWGRVGAALVVCHFFIPFFTLLSRRLKERAKPLIFVACWMIVMRFVDLTFWIQPAFHKANLHIHWLDIVVPIGLGGIWFWFYIWQLKGRPLMPLNDPNFEEAFSHGH